MIWLFKKIFTLGVLMAVAFVILHFQVGGRPVKDYLVDFYHSPIVQEGIRQAVGTVKTYLQKDIQKSRDGDVNPAPPMDKISDEERKELEKVIRKETRH